MSVPVSRVPSAAGNLRQCRRDHDALFLAAAERGEEAILQVQRSRRGQRRFDHRDVAWAFDLERAQMRIASHHRDFGDGVVEGELGLLRNDREPPRKECPRRVCERSAVEQDAAALRMPGSREDAQQGRFA